MWVYIEMYNSHLRFYGDADIVGRSYGFSTLSHVLLAQLNIST